MPHYRIPSLVHPRRIYPARVNWASPQSRGLTGWWPLGFGDGSETPQSHTRDTKTRKYSVLKPRDHDLVDEAAEVDDNFRPYAVADGDLFACMKFTTNFTQLNFPTTWATFVTASVAVISCWFIADGNGGATANAYSLSPIALDHQGFLGLSFGNRAGAGQNIYAYNWDGNEDFTAFSHSQNVWYHLTLRHAGGTLYLYVNGVQVGSTASGDTANLGFAAPQIGDYSAMAPANFRTADLRTYNADVPPEVIYQMWHPATRWDLYMQDPAWYFVPAAAGAQRRWIFGA